MPASAASRMRRRVATMFCDVEAVGRLGEDHDLAPGRTARAPEAPSGCCRRKAGRSASPRRACGRRSRARAGRACAAMAPRLVEAAVPEWRLADLLQEEIGRDGEGSRPCPRTAGRRSRSAGRAAVARRRRAARSACPPSRIAPGGSWPLAGKRLGELLLAVAVDAGDAEDLAGRDVEKLIAADAPVRIVHVEVRRLPAPFAA